MEIISREILVLQLQVVSLELVFLKEDTTAQCWTHWNFPHQSPENPLAIYASLLASCLVNPITLGKDVAVEAAGLLQPIDDGHQLVVPVEGGLGTCFDASLKKVVVISIIQLIIQTASKQ